MRHFQNVLFVSNGIDHDADALQQALSLAHDHGASATVLVSYPGLSSKMDAYKAAYEKQMLEPVEAQVAAFVKEKSLSVNVEIEGGDLPAERIIRRVLRNEHDLVVKPVASHLSDKGFAALDMDLLRKCPVPVWLCRPLAHKGGPLDLAVAIDPRGEDETAKHLSLRLLKLTQALATFTQSRISVISCWNYPYEDFLRRSTFASVDEATIKEAVENERLDHLDALQALLDEAGLADCEVHHVRGRPEETIPATVKDIGVDVLVMGTVARTGIPGFIIGNTSENILQQLGCSLMAAKPAGFVSPVKV